MIDVPETLNIRLDNCHSRQHFSNVCMSRWWVSR